MAAGQTGDQAEAGQPDGARAPVGETIADVDSGRVASLAASGLLWAVLKQWGSRVLAIVLFMVLARTLDPAHFGLTAFAAVFVGFLEVPIRVSLGDALVQRRQLTDVQLDSAFWMLIGLSGGLAAIMAASAPLVGRIVDNRELVPVLMTLALSLPLSGASVVPQAVLRRQMRFKALAVRTLGADLVGGVVAIALALGGAGVWALVVRIVVESTMMTVLAFVSVDWRPRFRFVWTELRDIARFGGWSVANSFIGFVSRHADDLIIGATIGSLALGYYVIAYQLLTIVVLLVTNTIEATALSAFSRLQDDRERVGRAFGLGVRASLTLVALLSAVTIALAPSIIQYFFGAKWLASTDLLRVLILGSLVAPAMSLSLTVMTSRGRPDLAARRVAIRTAIAVVAVLIGASVGLIWVGVAQIATVAVVLPLYLVSVGRLCTVRWRSLLWSALRLLGAGTVAGAVALAIAGTWGQPVDSLWRLILAGGSGSAAYAGAVWLVARGEVREVVGFVLRGRRGRKGARSRQGSGGVAGAAHP